MPATSKMTCFPSAQGVPELSGAPNWFDNSATAARPFDNSTDDPRWHGAMLHSFGNGTLGTVQFKALSGVEDGQSVLYLSWVVRAGPSNPGTDQVLIGLSTGTTGIIIRIFPQAQTTVIAGGNANYTIDIFVKPDASPNFPTMASAAANPAWITQYTRVWVNYTPNQGTPLAWAVEMVVPLAVNISPEPAHPVILNSTADFKMWYGLYLGVLHFGAVEYSWPGTPGIGRGFPTLAEFKNVRIASSIEDAACMIEGVEISLAGIGTKNVDGASRPAPSHIQVDLVNDPPTADSPDEQNLFFARPTFPANNRAYEKSRKESVRAHFRFANWGSQIGLNGSWMDIPGGKNVSFNDETGECRFIWPAQSDLGLTSPSNSKKIIDDIRNGVRTTHQCVLVQLSSVLPGGETFLVDSIYRNMDFVSASTFERGAEISVVGLAPLSSEPRDVYLFVETHNMPSFYPPESDRKRGPTPTTRERGVARRASMDIIPSVILPTYLVHAYHDTGKTTTLLDGKQRKILHPQTSFGYVASHEGQLYGWNTSLQGAKLIGPNLYVLSVPNNGAAHVTTRIEAQEKPGCSYYLSLLIYYLSRLRKQL